MAAEVCVFKARWVRVMAAVILATWSPGSMYCCCARAEAPSDPGRCATPIEARSHSCCASETEVAEPIESAQSCTTGCRDRDPIERSCGCAHGPDWTQT